MRRSVVVVIFLTYVNAAALLLEVSGTTAAMGVSAPTGVAPALEGANEAMADIEVKSGGGESLIQAIISTAQSFQAIFRALFAGPILLTAVGIPAPIVAFLFTPAAIIVGYDLTHLITGRLN